MKWRERQPGWSVMSADGFPCEKCGSDNTVETGPRSRPRGHWWWAEYLCGDGGHVALVPVS